MFSLSWLKTAWQPSDSARARCPRAFLPSPQPLLDGAGRNHPNPATSVTCSWTTPPLYGSTLLLRKAPCAGLRGSHTRPARLHHRRGHSRAETSAPSLGGLRNVHAGAAPPASVHIVRKVFQSTALQSGLRHLKKARAARRRTPFFAFASPCGRTCGAPEWWRSVDPTSRPGPPRSARRSAISPQGWPWRPCATASGTPWHRFSWVSALPDTWAQQWKHSYPWVATLIDVGRAPPLSGLSAPTSRACRHVPLAGFLFN